MIHLKNTKHRVGMGWVWLLVSLLVGQVLQAQQHPDARYPIPQLYNSVNQAGVNLATGDLNLELPLANLQSHQLNYNLAIFYNSASAGLSYQNNEVGGRGWKLMDYPKVVKNGSVYFYLDGRRSHVLTSSGGGNYRTAFPYHLWKFKFGSNKWVITTTEGTQLTLGKTNTAGGRNYWNLSEMKPVNFDDEIAFNYQSNGKIADFQCQFNTQSVYITYDGQGRIAKVLIKEGGRPTQESHLTYGSQGLENIQTFEFLLSGEKQATPKIHFFYDSGGRLNKMVSASGSIHTYTYYTSSSNPELVGKVIRYGTDNGYQQPTKNGQTPSGGDVDAGYSAIWYDLGNENTSSSIYTYFNKVRVYPGGFRNSANYNSPLHPFGHTTYYIFNGKARSSLRSVPTEYPSSFNTTKSALRGMVYQIEQYTNATVAETASARISKHKSIYQMRNYGGKDVPILTKTVYEQDGADAVATDYTYESTYHLPIEAKTLRRNPTKGNANKQEYIKTWRRYAFQDYASLNASGTNQLTAVSQQYTATAPSTNSNAYTVTSGQIKRWQNWGNNNWAPKEQHVLRNSIATGSFPVNLASTPGATNWLKTNEVTQRLGSTGLEVRQKDADGRTSSMLYDRNGEVPIAQFYNANLPANLINGQAIYLGFERYENTSSSIFNLSGGSFQTNDAHTGVRSYGGTGNIVIKYKDARFSPKAGERYVLGAFIKLRAGSTGGRLCFSSNNSCENIGTVTIPTNKIGQWQYVYLITNTPPNGSKGPKISCNNCLVDDFRVHPLKSTFSAWVFKDFRNGSGNGTVNSAGNHVYDNEVTVNAMTLANGQTLTVKAGQRIEVNPGVTLNSGGIVNLGFDNFAYDFTRTWATLGSNGETYRVVYGSDNAPIATVGPKEELRELNIGYNAREGIAMFGDSNPSDQYFDKNQPNAGLQVMPRSTGSFWEGFEVFSQGRFNLSGAQVVRQCLRATNTSAQATLTQTINKADYALYVEMMPNGLTGSEKMSLQIGRAKVEVQATQIRLYDNNAAISGDYRNLQQLPSHLNLLLVVTEGKKLAVYANGRFLFDHVYSGNLTGAPRLFATKPGAGFDNFMYLIDPVVGKQTFDATGNPTQTIMMETASKMMISENLYENSLNLPMASTRPTHITAGSGNNQGGLTFKDNFANLAISGNTLTATGDIAGSGGYNYNTPFTTTQLHDGDPTTRNDRSGGGGSFAVGNNNGAIRHTYEANNTSNGFGFGNDDLRKQVSQVPYTSGNQIQHTTYVGSTTGAPFASQITPTSGTSRKEQMEYDKHMRLTKHYQPKALNGSAGYTSTMAYNFLGNVLMENNVDGGRKQYAYDRQQRLRFMVDEEGKSGNYIKYWKYDALNRVIEEGIYNGYGSNVNLNDADDLQTDLGSNVDNAAWPSNGNRKVKRTYTYDDDANQGYAIGRLVRIVTYDTEGSTSGNRNIERYTYDADGNIVKHHLEIINGSQTPEITFDYTYNQAGQPTQISLNSSGSETGTAYTVSYTYDRLGRISMIGDGSDADRFASYTYLNGEVREMLSNTAFTRKEFTNQEGLLSKIEYGKDRDDILFREQMYYTTRRNGGSGYFNGNIASIAVDQGNTNTNTEYTYDGFGQLTQAGSDSYSYDLNGNMTSSPEFTNINHNSTNNRATAFGNTNFQYDLNGRVKTYSLFNFQYDKFLELTTSINYLFGSFNVYYGAKDQRVVKKTNTNSFTFYFHGLQEYPLIELRRNSSNPVGNYTMLAYVYGPRGIIAVNQSSIGGSSATASMVSTATMETEFGAQETNKQGFEHIDQTRIATLPAIDHTRLPANITPEVARLNASQGISQGPGKWIEVKAGDTIRAEVYAKYLDLATQQPNKMNVLGNLGVNGNPGGGLNPAEQVKAFTSVINPTSSLWAMLNQTTEKSGKAPKASLNYYLFDAQMQPLDAGLASVTNAAAITTATLYQPHEQLTLQVVAQQDGYVYVDVSHDAPSENVDVYFDDFRVVQSATRLNTGTWYYLLRDHIGSTRAVANESGTVLERYNYDAYGRLTTSPANFTLVRNGTIRYLYTGQEYDYTPRQYNYRARIYDPRFGRFLQPDPARQQNSAYAYVGGDPINRIDPDGEFWHIVAGAAIGGTISAGFSIGSQLLAGERVNWKKVGKAALVGAVAGGVGAATMGVGTTAAISALGSEVGGSALVAANVTVGAVSGAASGAAGQVTSNILEGEKVTQDLGSAAGVGAITGGVLGGITGPVSTQISRNVIREGARSEGTLVGIRSMGKRTISSSPNPGHSVLTMGNVAFDQSVEVEMSLLEELTKASGKPTSYNRFQNFDFSRAGLVTRNVARSRVDRGILAAHQKNRLGSNLGDYNLWRNSCVSCNVDILESMGFRVPPIARTPATLRLWWKSLGAGLRYKQD